MAFVYAGDVRWPSLYIGYGASPAIVDGVSVSAGDYVARIFRPQPGLTSIREAAFFVPSGSGAFTGEVRLETMDIATGLPSGTLAATSANVSFIGTLPPTVVSVTFAQPASVSPNTYYALKIACSGNSFSLGRVANAAAENDMFPYNVSRVAGVTARSVLKFTMGCGNPTDVAYLGGTRVISSLIAQTFNNGSSPNQYGAFFYHPAKIGVAGVELGPFENVGNIDVLLLNDAGTTLATTSVDFDGIYDFTNLTPIRIPFQSVVTLNALTTCRLFMKPLDGNNTAMFFWGISNAYWRNGFGEGEGAFYRTSRLDNGGPTDVTTQVPFINLIISHIDDGTGGEGSVTTVGVDTVTGSRFGRGFN